jgi:antitoxin HicB
MNETPRTVEDYLSLPYLIVLTPDHDDEGRNGWVAEVAELSGCISQGETPDEAVDNVRNAMAGWLSVALEDGQDIPPPRGLVHYSGRLLLRMPKTLHADAAREAENEGVSLNQFITAALAGALGWRSGRRAVPA